MNQSVRKQQRTLRNLLIEPFKQIKFGVYAASISTLFVTITSWLIFQSFKEQYQHVMKYSKS